MPMAISGVRMARAACTHYKAGCWASGRHSRIPMLESSFRRDGIHPIGERRPLQDIGYRPRYCPPPAAEAHGMGLPRPPLVSAAT